MLSYYRRLNESIDCMVHSGLTPQQQSGSYQAGDDDDEISVSRLEETGAPGGTDL